jgi:hypothetical protein
MRKVMMAALFLTGHAFAQTIPNAGFETWASAGPFLAPTGWGVTPGVKQSTDAHSGSYALLCEVDTATNPMTSVLDTVPGIAYTGAQSMTPPMPGNNVGGFALASVPDSLTGFYKFQSSASDTFLITVSLYTWDTAMGARRITGSATFTSSTSDSAYFRFSVPITDSGTSYIPDSAIIIIAASNPRGKAHLGTQLLVDDLAFTMATTAVPQSAPKKEAITAFPNPFCNRIDVDAHGKAVRSMMLKNTAGQTLATTTTTTIDATLLPSGTYFVVVEDVDGITYSAEVLK